MRKHLKLQQELFLAFTMDRLAPPMLNVGKSPYLTSVTGKKGSSRPGTPGSSTPVLGSIDTESDGGSATPPRLLVPPAKGETRDLMLETLSQLSRHPSFMVDLYSNYDCDINCENLFERLIDFLTKVRCICLTVSVMVYSDQLACRVYIRASTREDCRVSSRIHSICVWIFC